MANKCCSCSRFFSCLCPFLRGNDPDALPPVEGTASDALPPVEGTASSDVPAVMEIPSVGISSSAIEEGNVDLDALIALIEHISNRLEHLKEGTKSSHKKTKTAQQYLPTTSKSFIKLKEFLSEAANFVGFSARERETGKNIIVDSGFSLLNKDRSIISQSVPVKLCRICFEESSDMFEGSLCFHRFCEACMTRYIHSMLEQRRHQIYCPHETCREALTLDECRYFLPAEIFEQWSAVMVEAEIPEALKVYCPFSDCSGLLVKESVGTLDVEEVEMAECPFCNRLFCARCKVPWHANLQCSEFQSLPTTDKTEPDFLLLKLAEDHKWRRCGKCKSMVELIYGCNHITCRCQHEFCYVCGTSWRNGSPDCNCPRTTVDRLIH